MTETDVEVALAEHGKEIGSLKHRVNEMEHIVDAVHSLAVEMARQTGEIKHMNESIRSLNLDVAALKEKPVARWESVINALIGAVVGAAAALLFQ